MRSPLPARPAAADVRARPRGARVLARWLAAVVVGARNWITPPSEFDDQFFPQADWIVDAIHEKILPLKGHIGKHDNSDAETMRRAKKGV